MLVKTAFKELGYTLDIRKEDLRTGIESEVIYALKNGTIHYIAEKPVSSRCDPIFTVTDGKGDHIAEVLSRQGDKLIEIIEKKAKSQCLRHVPLCSKLLQVIAVVQTKAKLGLREGILFEDKTDWRGNAEKYFYALPDELIESLKIKKNKLCFQAILDFKITDEIACTNRGQLGRFVLVY